MHQQTQFIDRIDLSCTQCGGVTKWYEAKKYAWGSACLYLYFCERAECFSEFLNKEQEQQIEPDVQKPRSDSKSNEPRTIECSQSACTVRITPAPGKELKIAGQAFCSEKCIHMYQIECYNARLGIRCRNCSTIDAWFSKKWCLDGVGQIAFCNQKCFDEFTQKQPVKRVPKRALSDTEVINVELEPKAKAQCIDDLRHQLLRAQTELADVKRKYKAEQELTTTLQKELEEQNGQAQQEADEWKKKYNDLRADVNEAMKTMKSVLIRSS